MVKKYDVVGVGNAIVDCLAHVDEEFLAINNMQKGAMQLISAEYAADLLQKLHNVKKCSGGSVANSIAALASLNVPTAFLGRVADDELGESFTGEIKQAGVYFSAKPALGGKPTACCIICVSPDGERTMNTFIGASAEVTVANIEAEVIEQSKILYLEGYLWDAEPAKEAILQAIHVAHDHGVKIAFSASDAFCVNRHRDEFLHLIKQHIDILFMNEDEAKALLERDDLENVALELATYVEVALITRSSEAAIIASGEKLHHVTPQKVAKVEDATGAGDAFAAGFLYGYLKDLGLERSAEIGHKLASNIIQQMGARSIKPLLEIIT
jgi:sugar/nucleoside kinase (ribokinase family)